MFSALLVPQAGTSVQEDIDKGRRMLTDAAAACGGDPEERLMDLWGDITDMGLVAIDVWPIDSPSKIEPGRVIHFADPTRWFKLRRFALVIDTMDTTLNGKGSTIGGPEQAAIIFGQTLQELQTRIQKLARLCSNELHSLGEQMPFIHQRRMEIVESLRQASKSPR